MKSRRLAADAVGPGIVLRVLLLNWYSEQVALDEMLSRGIDPDLGDPSRCHAHPAPPPAWPSEAELRAYAAGERSRVEAAVARGVGGGEAAGAGGISMRGVCLVLEHERMHQETLAYMRTQQVALQSCTSYYFVYMAD